MSEKHDLTIQDIEVRLLLEAIYLRYNYDFRKYGMASVKRRLQSALAAFRLPTISAFQEKILRDADFFTKALQYLTISTTEFFRDPEYFKMFREKVVPHLQSYPSLKLWIAGCSTGEEAYSFAITLKEENLYEKTMIYATDINPVSLETARNGIYRIDEFKKYTQNYQASGGRTSLSDYYDAGPLGVTMKSELRKNIVFADHSLATDSVFGEMHFVSCRNVMIYFERDLQNRALRLFHDSLARRCFLGIGEKETIKFSSVANDFDTFAMKERIYRRRT